jgi:D-glycero-beta-D-manno-heptose-7-phosphate kinase
VDAAQIANTAAALVVRRLGNAVVTPEELAAALALLPDQA